MTSSSQDHDAPTSTQSVSTESRFTRREDHALTRKLDAHLVPVIFVLYSLAFLDRSNIGNAYTAGMGDELHISSSQYQWILTIYYIPYILFQTVVLAWKVVPPRVMASSMAFAWGTVSMLQATAFNWSSIMVARFFIGVFEASFAPGVALYLSYFYPRYQFGLRFGIYASGAALASSFAGLLAYGLVHVTDSRVAPWRLLFIVEGAPTVLFAPFVFYLLPNSIKDCHFLTDREKELSRLRMKASSTDIGDNKRKDEGGSGGINWQQVLLSLRDPINYLTAVLFFIANVTFASLPVYLPTILREAGFSAVRAQGLSAPPYFAAFLSAIFFTFLSDRLQHRGMFIAALSCVGGIGYLVLATQTAHWVRYGATFLVAIGCFSVVPLLYAWISNNQARESQRGAGFALFGVIGQCGPLLGVRLYPSHDGPNFVRGMSIGAGLLFFAVILAACLSTYFTYLNMQLDRQNGPSSLAQLHSGQWKHKSDSNLDEGEEFLDVELLEEASAGAESIHFRYVP